MQIKKFKFRDIQYVSKLVKKLNLNKEEISEIVDILTNAQAQMFVSEPEVEKYLIENLDGAERRKLYEETDGEFEKLRDFALNHKGISTSASLFDVILKVVNILADRFDVLVDFMEYYLVDYTAEQIYEFEAEEAAQAIQGVIRNEGFGKFFSSLFNSK